MFIFDPLHENQLHSEPDSDAAFAENDFLRSSFRVRLKTEHFRERRVSPSGRTSKKIDVSLVLGFPFSDFPALLERLALVTASRYLPLLNLFIPFQTAGRCKNRGAERSRGRAHKEASDCT